GSRERQDRAAGPQRRGERLQVAGQLLHLALVGRDDQQGPVGEEQGGEEASGTGEARDLGPLAPREDLPQAGQARLGLQAGEGGRERAGGHGQPCRMRSRSWLVDRPCTISTRNTRPPEASTSSRPTMASSAQSAPFTRTSGRRARTTSRGVGSS